MSDYNVYNNPEKFDLEWLAEHSFSSEAYQFDYRVVWLHKPTGTLYTARDAGCSCPSPFEDYKSIKSLDVVSLEELRDEAVKESMKNGYNGDPPGAWIEKIKQAAIRSMVLSGQKSS